MDHVAMTFARTTGIALLLLPLLLVHPQRAAADPDDILAGAFDAATGVPFASTMLGIVRSGEEVPTTPSVLDKRIAVVEALLADIEPRLALVEARLKQVQVELVGFENRARLNELKTVKDELAVINEELKTHPTDAGQRKLLAFRAMTAANRLKNSVDFDVWKWSNVTSDQTIRTRFMVYPSFEVYAVAIATWFAALDVYAGDQPQRIVSEYGSALLDHAAFLTTPNSFHLFADEPVTLDEHLRTAAFSRLVAVDRFADAGGNCVFAIETVDTMTDTTVETGRETIGMRPPIVGTLCTTSPAQSVGLDGEQALQDRYGAQVMVALAHDLDQLAHTGSLRPPFVGTFGNFIEAQIFSIPLDGPVVVGAGAVAGARPAVPLCRLSIGGGCNRGVTLSRNTAWELRNVNPSAVGGSGGAMTLRQIGSGLCLDVKGGVAVAGAEPILFSCNGTASQVWTKQVTNVGFRFASGGGMCVAIAPALPSNVGIQLARGLVLQPCDGGPLQNFSHSDSTLVGPH